MGEEARAGRVLDEHVDDIGNGGEAGAPGGARLLAPLLAAAVAPHELVVRQRAVGR